MLYFLCAALVLGLGAAGICLYAYRTCFYSPKDRNEDPYALLPGKQYRAACETISACTRIMDKAACEWVEITSFDGLSLKARFYPGKPGFPVLILFHGYRSAALRDCSGSYILGQKLGFSVLAVDQRAHGASEGTVISFGILERRDCQAWAQYAAGRFGSQVPILLAGLSMGAATVLMASELPLPESVAGIIADCPYSAPAAIIRKVCRDRKMPDKPLFPFIRASARLLGGFRLEEATALDAVSKAKHPILLLHGEDDRFVPCEMSRKIHEACASSARLYTFPGAGHGLCYITDPMRYEAVCVRFLYTLPTVRPYLENSAYVADRLSENPQML